MPLQWALATSGMGYATVLLGGRQENATLGNAGLAQLREALAVAKEGHAPLADEIAESIGRAETILRKLADASDGAR